MGDQDKYRIGTRLFQGLEQGVGRIGVHGLGRMQDRNLAQTLLGGFHDKLVQVTDLVHLENAPVVFRGKYPHIWVAAGLKQQTGLTGLASMAVNGCQTHQEARQIIGEGFFTYSFGPTQNNAMGHATGLLNLLDLLPNPGLPWKRNTHTYTSFIVCKASKIPQSPFSHPGSGTWQPKAPDGFSKYRQH